MTRCETLPLNGMMNGMVSNARAAMIFSFRLNALLLPGSPGLQPLRLKQRIGTSPVVSFGFSRIALVYVVLLNLIC